MKTLIEHTQQSFRSSKQKSAYLYQSLKSQKHYMALSFMLVPFFNVLQVAFSVLGKCPLLT